VGSVPWNVASQMEKDEYLQQMIQSTCFVYAWWLKMAWDDKTWDWKFTRTNWTEELIVVLDFHESKIIHGK
jgi:hypothetical protein